MEVEVCLSACTAGYTSWQHRMCTVGRGRRAGHAMRHTQCRGVARKCKTGSNVPGVAVNVLVHAHESERDTQGCVPGACRSGGDALQASLRTSLFAPMRVSVTHRGVCRVRAGQEVTQFRHHCVCPCFTLVRVSMTHGLCVPGARRPGGDAVQAPLRMSPFQAQRASPTHTAAPGASHDSRVGQVGSVGAHAEHMTVCRVRAGQEVTQFRHHCARLCSRL